MHRRRLLTLAVLLLFVVGAGWSVRFVFFQPPAEQLGRVQAKLLRAVEKRDWKTIRAMLADEYMDDFGHDHETALQTAQDILSGYFSLTLKTQTTYQKGTNDVGMVKQKIKIEGTGTPVSQMVTTRVNATTEPWVFHWLKKGRWPWNWKLVQVQNQYIQ